MLTIASALVWILLFWLVASDNKLPWSLNLPKAKAKNASSPKDQVNARTVTFGSYARVTAYIAMAALIWSSPPSSLRSPTSGSQPAQPAEPSFRLDSATLGPSHDQGSEQTGIPIESLQQDTSDEIFHEAIHNETLGFQKVFVVNLPERTDKRDAMSLISALTNIKLTWTNALRGATVPDKALPLGVDRATWRDGGIGSWRSQMNIIRT